MFRFDSTEPQHLTNLVSTLFRDFHQRERKSDILLNFSKQEKNESLTEIYEGLRLKKGLFEGFSCWLLLCEENINIFRWNNDFLCVFILISLVRLRGEKKGDFIYKKILVIEETKWNFNATHPIKFSKASHVLKCVKSSLFCNSFQYQHVFTMLL